MSFLNPNVDIQGADIKSTAANIGSGMFGGWFGQSRQKYLYLPQVTMHLAIM